MKRTARLGSVGEHAGTLLATDILCVVDAVSVAVFVGAAGLAWVGVRTGGLLRTGILRIPGAIAIAVAQRAAQLGSVGVQTGGLGWTQVFVVEQTIPVLIGARTAGALGIGIVARRCLGTGIVAIDNAITVGVSRRRWATMPLHIRLRHARQIRTGIAAIGDAVSVAIFGFFGWQWCIRQAKQGATVGRARLAQKADASPQAKLYAPRHAVMNPDEQLKAGGVLLEGKAVADHRAKQRFGADGKPQVTSSIGQRTAELQRRTNAVSRAKRQRAQRLIRSIQIRKRRRPQQTAP